MRFVQSLLLLILSTTLVGCSPTNYVIYPASQQGPSVNQVVRSGYTFLRSEKEGSVATVSLRRATDSYVQTYVSLSNRGTEAVKVSPEAITVKEAEGSRSFAAYSPEEAPSIVQRAAEGSRRSFVGMNSMNVTGSVAMGGETGEAGSQGAYGTDSDARGSYMDLMLKEQVLGGQQASSGLVFTPFSKGVEAFQMKIPVGEATHTFRFAVQKDE